MMNHSSPNEPSLDNNDGEINLDQLLSAEIQITSQPLMEWSTTTRMPSQKLGNPNNALHPIVTTRQLARRRYRQTSTATTSATATATKRGATSTTTTRNPKTKTITTKRPPTPTTTRTK
ncbi:unnamed protein product [Rotaria socialis]|uniref:Uncharacterized protein n=1 Tax=Rotaria socialis TaxID=392032 RepID=A0A818LGU3_9BILA|nr:unnamed protein product [Rotaria socialis]